MLSGGIIMRKVSRNNITIRAGASVAGLMAVSMILGGCSSWIEQLATMPMAEQTSATYTTVRTTVAGVEETTTESTTDRRPDDPYVLEDVENELGPYTRYECSGYYVWDNKDGTETWVYYLDKDGYISHILKSQGLKETLLYSVDGDESIFRKIEADDFKATQLMSREFGPDLDLGWYIYEEAEDSYYIFVCNGREFTRGNFIYLQTFKYEIYDTEVLTLTIDVDSFSNNLPEVDTPSYPCCGISASRLPQYLIVQTINGNEIPFKGYLSDAEDWGIDVDIEDDYAFILTDDGSDERRTYVYETDDGYEYINAVIMKDSGKTLVKGTGPAYTPDDISLISQRFESYKYVLVNGDEDTKIAADEYIQSLSN